MYIYIIVIIIIIFIIHQRKLAFIRSGIFITALISSYISHESCMPIVDKSIRIVMMIKMMIQSTLSDLNSLGDRRNA